jgi:PDZ domain-containing protein
MRALVRKRLGQALTVVSALAMVSAFVVPLPYVIVKPGPTFNVLGEVDGKEVIEISGGEGESSVGVLDLTTVSTYGSPGETPSLLSLLGAYISTDQIILPLDSVYPLGKTTEETDAEQKQNFQDAETSAVKAALRELGSTADATSIKFNLDDIGGPSGGLIFALGVIDKLTSGQLTGGKAIAGTGTIEADGTVGEIGGIRMKMTGALLAGDWYFLAPRSNCRDIVGFEPEGLTVIPVDDLHGALEVLKVIAADGDLSRFPACTLK